MDITYTLGEPLEDRTRRADTITITLTPNDDPARPHRRPAHARTPRGIPALLPRSS